MTLFGGFGTRIGESTFSDPELLEDMDKFIQS
jgi:hypothetical protein